MLLRYFKRHFWHIFTIISLCFTAFYIGYDLGKLNQQVSVSQTIIQRMEKLPMATNYSSLQVLYLLNALFDETWGEF